MKLAMRRYEREDDFWEIRQFLRDVYLRNGRTEHSWQTARWMSATEPGDSAAASPALREQARRANWAQEAGSTSPLRPSPWPTR